ncbi:MAG: helix-turn-helix domain-containing protein [Candidatus Freyarchaeota archaeon]
MDENELAAGKLPREVLERAATLRDPHGEIYLALYSRDPSTAAEIARMVGHARAYVHTRLLQLVDMGLVKARRKGRTVMFEAV